MKWIKLVILGFMVFIISCTKMEIEPTPPPTTQNIFTVSESSIKDGQTIYFNLPSDGVYIITYVDVETNQVLSREKFNGKLGENTMRIYTKSIMSKYLYLILTTEDKTEINKTKLILN
jgi:hypothetical protein